MRLFYHHLSISPYKNAEKLNTIGAELAKEYGVPYLFSDFKKRNGYQALHRVEPGIPPLPPELLRMRLFPRGSPGAGRQIKRTKGTSL